MNPNTKHKLKGVCCICSDPTFAWKDKKKYCSRCFRYKKRGFTNKQLIKEFR